MQRSGIPDLLICCNGMFLGVELKTEVGVASDLQENNIIEIQEAGGIGMVLRPSQFEEFKQLIRRLNNSAIQLQ